MKQLMKQASWPIAWVMRGCYPYRQPATKAIVGACRMPTAGVRIAPAAIAASGRGVTTDGDDPRSGDWPVSVGPVGFLLNGDERNSRRGMDRDAEINGFWCRHSHLRRICRQSAPPGYGRSVLAAGAIHSC